MHVQTEDRGAAHALLDTTVYYRGRVLHRRTNNYFDLLPLNEDRKQALKLRLEEQHRTVMEEIRSGALELPIPAEPAPPPGMPAITSVAEPRPPAPLHLELVNAKSWLVGKHANLHVRVKQPDGGPVSGAGVTVEFEGSDREHVFVGQTNELGDAHVEFELPRITGAEAALAIRAAKHGSEGHLRFALRAKPRVPSV